MRAIDLDPDKAKSVQLDRNLKADLAIECTEAR